MAKLKNALFSLAASNTIGKVLTFRKRKRVTIAEKKPDLIDAKSAAQLSWRHMYQKAIALWHALSVAEKVEWESLARRKHMTGYAFFLSQALKPNPGLYLPLQGGTMAGDIDMAKHRLLKLPSPTDSQEAASKTYVDTEIAGALYIEGARVNHFAHQSIPNTTYTILAFNRERWDTDGIHDIVTNNSRLTCKTAGKYIITFHGQWHENAVGVREIRLILNGSIFLTFIRVGINANGFCNMVMSTIYDLAVSDYLEVQVYQSSGAPLNFERWVEQSPEFMMQRIG